MDRASKFIYIAVNEYLPMDVYKNNHYWPDIDEKIRSGIDWIPLLGLVKNINAKVLFCLHFRVFLTALTLNSF